VFRHRIPTLLVATGAVIGCLLVPSASIAGAAPAGSAFYTSPSPSPAGTHGQLIGYQTTTVNLGSGAPSVKAWNIMYYTEDALGATDVATGTVLMPTASWTGTGSRPLIDYAPGTQGLGQACAPSAQLTAGTEYEAVNLVAILKRGWAVTLTDYQGYTTGSQTLYTVGAAEGHAVLDEVNATNAIPGVGLAFWTPVAIWGYSQGGQAAAWAGQLYQAYDPTFNLVGVAAGGIPADVGATAGYLDGGPTAGFGAMAYIGLSNQYPSVFDLSALENSVGAAATAVIENECVFATLLQFEHATVAGFTKSGEGLSQLEANPAIAALIAAQKLGGTPIPVPVYQYHGQADEAIPLAQDITLKQEYCAQGVTDDFVLYPGEHITTQFQAAPNVISWISGRIVPGIGKYDAPSDCGDPAPPPTSTATPSSGDWLVALNKWPVSAWVHLKAMDATLDLPSNASFTGATDITTQQLVNGELSVPTFSTTVYAYGLIPMGITQTLVQEGPANGTAVLDTSGNLHITASASAEILLPNLSFLGINLVSSSCRTSSPVTFPLSFNGPISSLGDGQLTFTGSTTFPTLTGCGLLTPVLNLLFPGPGQTFSFTVSPPAPVSY